MASGLFIGSYVALWAVVLLLSLAILVMTRQIALLHSRILPAGAKAGKAGPKVGEKIEPFQGEDIYSNKVAVPASQEKATLLLFISDGCAVCGQIAPAVNALARQEKDVVDVVLASFNGDAPSNRAYAQKIGLAHFPFFVSKDFAYSNAVFTAPYALMIDREGTVRSKGVVNTKEHLDSLLNVLDVGFANREEFFRSSYKLPLESGELLEAKAVNGTRPEGRKND
jgi:methylamine dehydrogenase accessory protein MauD